MRTKWIAGGLAAAGAVAVGALAIDAMRPGPAPADAVLVGNSDQVPRVVGLTRGGDLVSFRADKPGDARRIGAVKGLTTDKRWSASTSGCRTASCTASATKAASTR
ncbi:hypothetical protein [Asanoa siamensis]|uniref:Uncharacterized protein n=1 Tax=Asanoa siamensis TaxID=926357 RepID=A0ABQ4CZD6_9ACTN|nr:hypothetical protein [Asanoa siamensis]GIF76654.1 hypothetical protein Asi02nite_61720 [Asanoa siamensis]